MVRIVILILLNNIAQVYCLSASVSLILYENRNWTNIVCPSIKSGNRVDFIDVDKTVRSKTSVEFKCSLVEKNKNLTQIPYHFLLLFPEDSSQSLRECPTIDDCFRVNLVQHGVNLINVHISAVKPCFSSKLSLRYELRQGNTLIDSGITFVLFGKKPDTPSYLHFRMNESQIESINGYIQQACTQDALTTKYSMKYNIRGVQECQSTDQYSPCKVVNDAVGRYRIVCPVRTLCDATAMCSAVVTAYIVGINNIGQKGDISRRFSKSLSFVTARPISPNITKQTLNSLTVNFFKPVTCSSAYQHFQYKISYRKPTAKQWVTFQDDPCKSKEVCSAYITGLQMNTDYIVCIAYTNIKDIVSSFSDPACTNGSSANLPCKAPNVYQITPIKVDSRHWKAIVHWKTISTQCWNDDQVEMNSMSHYYSVEISDGNVTRTYQVASSANSTIGGLTYLQYNQKYTVTLSSCNLHGCINGRKTFLHIRRVQRKSSNKNNKQSITETVLICVLSLLFLAASSFLCFILRKRKQFQRLRLKRKLQASDIKIVREGEENKTIINNKVVSRGMETTPHTSIRKQERRVITVDTRPLITHKTSVVSAHSIPENSTLV